jgi:phage shock protein A
VCFILSRAVEANIHSGGSEWQDPKLEELLQQRMPKTYPSYMDTVKSMLETIHGLEESLGTDKTHFQSHVSITEEYVR